MDEKNLNPMEEENTPEVADTEAKADETATDVTAETEGKGGFMEFFKKKKALVIVLAVVAVLLVCGVAIALVGILGVDTSVATPDETEPTTQAPTTQAPTTAAPAGDSGETPTEAPEANNGEMSNYEAFWKNWDIPRSESL